MHQETRVVARCNGVQNKRAITLSGALKTHNDNMSGVEASRFSHSLVGFGVAPNKAPIDNHCTSAQHVFLILTIICIVY
jgi:hypothetical protein